MNNYDLAINELKMRMDRMAQDIMLLEHAREAAAQRALDASIRKIELEEVLVRS